MESGETQIRRAGLVTPKKTCTTWSYTIYLPSIKILQIVYDEVPEIAADQNKLMCEGIAFVQKYCHAHKENLTEIGLLKTKSALSRNYFDCLNIVLCVKGRDYVKSDTPFL